MGVGGPTEHMDSESSGFWCNDLVNEHRWRKLIPESLKRDHMSTCNFNVPLEWFVTWMDKTGFPDALFYSQMHSCKEATENKYFI